MTFDDLIDAKIMLRELERALAALDGGKLIVMKDEKEVVTFSVSGVWRLDHLFSFLEAVRLHQ